MLICNVDRKHFEPHWHVHKFLKKNMLCNPPRFVFFSMGFGILNVYKICGQMQEKCNGNDGLTTTTTSMLKFLYGKVFQ